MSGRFPGAKNIEEFWHNLRNGVESVSFLLSKTGRCRCGSCCSEGLHYVKAKPVLKIYLTSFFGFNPREAEITDPQHRLFLECAWSALESAGYNSETYAGSIGVYAGAGSSGPNTYLLNNLIQTVSLENQLAITNFYCK